jgi:hypothetical protein
MNTNHIRRDFLKKMAALAGVLVFAPSVTSSFAKNFQIRDKAPGEGKTPRINPAFRIKKLGEGSIELYTFQKPGSKLSYRYSGLEAGVLLMLMENKPLEENLDTLAAQFSLSTPVCKSMVNSSMAQFEKKGLIYYGELMLVKITETKYE